MKHSKLKIFLATLLTIFNLSVCFAGTYAWFVAAQANSAESMQVQMYTHELDMSYRVYKYIDDAKEAQNVTGRPDALTLPEYDSVITSRNTNTSIILDFNITGMSLGEGIPVWINTHCTNDTTTERVLSNIIRIQFANIPSITSPDANTIYTQANQYFDNNSITENKFKNGDVKSQDILYQLNNYVETNGVVRLFIRLDYSIALINEFQFSLSDIMTTNFPNDITLINCYSNEN